MLSKQELLSYVRLTYQEYQDNDNYYDDTFDNFIEKRCENANYSKKSRFNGYDANIM